jgi:DNA polymerase-3 subunit gamma/tau
MGEYIVSARKYRPSTFKSVIGQPSITNTLKNAIQNNHLAHAYLFCGPRGVGKTTCARIFAKTLNCFNRTSETEACNECESCKAFNENRSYNIHELDAASNNSVDDIRNLIDQVRIPPQLGKYSIYIIDEVHMLSAAAFNAFLKTLEEPPVHAFFVLATTEKHKIIPTILSRCQIFDFSRIKIDDTVRYLSYIAQNEGIQVEPDALHVVAQKADGGMRDALSIFDQIVSFSGSQITYKSVIENLNVLDYEYYFQMVDAFLEQNVSKTLLLFNEILDKGFDGHIFINGLASHLRDLLVSKDEITLQLLEVSTNVKEQYKVQAKKCTPYFLFEALNICGKCDIAYKASKNQRLHVELALIQICVADLEKKKPEPTPDNLSQSTVKQTGTKEQSNVNPGESPKKTNPKIVSPIPSFSLKDAIKGEPQTKEASDTTPPPQHIAEPEPVKFENKAFTQNQLNEAWLKFAETLKTEDPRMFSTLSAQTPLLVENFAIELTLINLLQEEAVLKLKPQIVTFLKKELDNNNIDLKTIIKEPENSQKFFNDKERFEFMSQKNPNLLKIKQQFGLDFG